MANPQSYEINIPNEKIDDIRQPVSSFPWHSFLSPGTRPDGEDWGYGPPPVYMRSLCDHWLNKYDWQKRQARMNDLPHFMVTIEGLDVHFVHERGSGDGNLPVLLLHGWPYTFHSFHHMVQELAHPERFGGKAADSVDVIVPSMPGYDFSSPPSRPIGPRVIADMYDELMVEVLGYNRYIAHGGDWGSYVAERLGYDHGDHCSGIHLTMISVRHHGAAPKSSQVPSDATDEEKAFVDDEMRRWIPQSPYARLQSTVPMKLGYAMADSPVGVAAWIIEAFHAWSDLSHGKRFEELYPFDDLLDEVMLYLVTDSFHTSTWLYVGEAEEGSNTLPPGERIGVPVSILALPDPVFPMLPRAVAERSHRVVRYEHVDHGGHFPFYEARRELVADLQVFLKGAKDGTIE